VGTWLQVVAQGWLIFQMTHSAFWVGVVAAVGNLPILIFALFSGVIVDRVDRKKILIYTQYASMVLALILGVLTIMNTITVLELNILSFLLGVVTAVDLPARQAFMTEMVDKKKIASAVALNSGMFNGARVIGPGIAGILIGLVGTGGAFILNGLSYIAAIIVLYLIHPLPREVYPQSHPIDAIKEGISYVASHPVIRNLILLAGVVTIFGFSYTTVLPVMVSDIYHQDASLLGYIYAAAGVGAVVGALSLSIFAERIPNTFFISSGTILSAISLFVFASTTNILLAYLAMFVSGLGLVLLFSTITTTIQHLVDDAYRGRVMSIYTIAFLGVAPLGSILIGIIAQYVSTPFSIQYGCVVYLLFGGIMFLRRNITRKHYREYAQETLKI
jgi:MFS family permease